MYYVIGYIVKKKAFPYRCYYVVIHNIFNFINISIIKIHKYSLFINIYNKYRVFIH